MLALTDDRLELHLPEAHPEALLRVEFRRTLRTDAPLPRAALPDRGRLPLRDVDGHAERVLGAGGTPPGIFFALHQGEAMRIRLEAPHGYPFALRLIRGGVDAFTGRRAVPGLLDSFENYRVVLHTRELAAQHRAGGGQPFVVPALSMRPAPAGEHTAERSPAALQLVIYAMRGERFEALRSSGRPAALRAARAAFGPSAWDDAHRAHCFVHALNSRQYVAITGREPPNLPPTAEDYAQAGLPWRDDFDADRRLLATARRLVLTGAPACFALRDAPCSRPGERTGHAGVPARRNALAVVRSEGAGPRPAGAART
ncbi:MAG: hypothetical protein IT514_13050 [Burkholderiales bacterium]|nr:hypothetical protein [Burkholderiales bacterium]